MGHGNGWPSPYRDSLYPPTQNGFGLNPSADGNDYQHQYFGEGVVGRQVHLAKDAVVLLHHLCYASGNSEPGVAEGNLDTAKLRVDNFAAGFIKAGASAVLADAYASPSGYLAAVLGGGRSLDTIWRRAPNANGNAFAFDSARSRGYIAQMDPVHATSGFTRSIVLRAGLTPAQVRAGAEGGGGGPGAGPVVPLPPPIPSLVKTPVRFKAPDIAARPAAGSVIRLDLPLKTANGLDLLEGLQASIRWDPLSLLSPSGAVVAPGASPTPQPPPGPLPPPESVDLVTAERPGDVVAPQAVKLRTSGLSLPVTAPAAPGTYRLTRHAPRQGWRGLRQRDPGDAPDAHRAGHRRPRRRGPRGTVDDPHRGQRGRDPGACREPRHQLLGCRGRRRSDRRHHRATGHVRHDRRVVAAVRRAGPDHDPAARDRARLDRRCDRDRDRAIHPGRAHPAARPVHAGRAVPDGRGRRPDPDPRHVGDAALGFASMVESNAVPGFLPSTHGLRFPNRFPPGPTLRLGLVDPRIVGIGDASTGLCGGMSWLVRERFEAGRPIEPDPDAPANGTPLFRTLVRRQVLSLDWLRTPLKFWWMGVLSPDRARERTWDVEWPRIRADIDAGRLAMVGLIRHEGRSPWRLTQSHQVLAFAYETDGRRDARSGSTTPTCPDGTTSS